MDSKTFRTLEFDKVRARLAEHTSFSGSEAAARALLPTTDIVTARRWQAETAEALFLFDRGSEVGVGGTRDVRQAVDNALRGYTLPAEDLLAIRSTLEASRTLQRSLLKWRDDCPRLAAIADLIEECPGIVKAINTTIDDRGDVLDGASEKLFRLRTQLRVAYGRIQDKLQSILNSARGQFLQESIITMRSGRYVIPLRAEARGRIPGIVHDHSGSGATLWIEPMITVELNNEYRELQIKETDEVQRILAELSAKVADQGEAIKRIVENMIELDLIFARAHYAGALGAVAPEFVEWRAFAAPRPPKHANERAKWTPPPRNPHPGSTLWIRGARHPLLDQEKVIPTDLLVPDDVFLVLITGPNTGGKTVSLKTAGLMVLMAQSGLHLPAREARLTVFDNVFADIGDEQSIEQSLSTFSAHITNIIRILGQVDDRSLVVLDELGSGTDPAEGAAIAQALVNFLRDKGATTFIATHYPELKIYASQTQGATNASLMFDEETLSPTYEMTIGIPGRSNAIAISRRLGLDDSVISDALGLLGRGSSDAQSLLDSIHEIRDKIQADEAATRLAQQEAAATREELLDRLEAIETEREKILAEARLQAEAELAEIREEVRRARRQMKLAPSKTAAKKLHQELETKADELAARPLDEPDEPVLPARPAPARPKRTHFLEGDTVLVKSLKVTGEILRLDGSDVEIAVGRLKMRADVRDLELKARPEPEPEPEPVMARAAAIGGSPGMELDLRGLRVADGLQRLEQYLESAYLANLPWVRLIHGKGTGRMRMAVRDALKKNEWVASWEEGKDGEGGDGVTVAKFS